MTELDICDKQGRLYPHACLLTYAYMLFHDSEPHRSALEINDILYVLKSRGETVAPLDLAIRLQSLPNKEQMHNAIAQRLHVGRTVGQIYIMVLALHLQGKVGARASVNTVVQVLTKEFANKGIAGKTTLENWWAKMRPVRHFWAAWYVRDGTFSHFEYLEDERGGAQSSFDADFEQFLLEADIAADTGRRYRSPSTTQKHSSLLDNAEAILLPARWRRPAPFGPFGKLRLPRPTEKLLNDIAALKTSEPPHKPRRR